jgi:Shikimate kinase
MTYVPPLSTDFITEAVSPLEKTNVILIGMPGSGKSTSGILLAKTLGLSFLDSDLLIQQQEGTLLQDIVNQKGFFGFVEIEERIVSNLSAASCVISTGGSVVYSEKSMNHFQKIGRIVYLDVSFSEIMRRIQNISTRGIALKDGQSLKNLYDERLPLYQKYADLTVSGDGKTIEELVTEIAEKIKPFLK